MNQLENCQARYRSNTWMGRTRTDSPDEFEPTKFDCNSVSLYYTGIGKGLSQGLTFSFVILASTRENLSSDVCEQHRHRPACAV